MNDDQMPHLPDEPGHETLPEALADYLDLIGQVVDKEITDQDIEDGLQQLLGDHTAGDGGEPQPGEHADPDIRPISDLLSFDRPPTVLQGGLDELMALMQVRRAEQRRNRGAKTQSGVCQMPEMIYVLSPATEIAEAQKKAEVITAKARAEAQAEAEKILDAVRCQAEMLAAQLAHREAQMEHAIRQTHVAYVERERIIEDAQNQAREILEEARREADQCQDDALREAIHIVDKANAKAGQILDTARQTSDIIVEAARQSANTAITNALTEARQIRESAETSTQSAASQPARAANLLQWMKGQRESIPDVFAPKNTALNHSVTAALTCLDAQAEPLAKFWALHRSSLATDFLYYNYRHITSVVQDRDDPGRRLLASFVIIASNEDRDEKPKADKRVLSFDRQSVIADG